ncbi:MAG: ATP-binding protein, partial [Candidatus Margulisiibacteriota bacterium]
DWLVKKRQQWQAPPDLVARAILQFKEVVRKNMQADDFRKVDEVLELIGWGFTQRYFNEIVSVLMATQTELEQRVAERTQRLEVLNQQIQEWNRALELNIQDRTRDLLAEQKKLTTIIENISDGILVTDFENKISQVNLVAKKILGIKQKNVQNKHVLEFISSTVFLKAVSDTIDQGPGVVITRDIELAGAGGRKKIVQVYATLAINENREPMVVISVLRDITSARELENAKAGFLNTAAHELRTPLTSIIGFISLLMDPGFGKLDNTQKDFLGSALKNCYTLKHLINDLLELTRIDAGKMQLKIEKIAAGALLSEVYRTCAEQAKQKKIQLILKKPPQKMIFFYGDKVRLRQAVHNLCDNAIKFTAKGSVTIAYRQVQGLLEISIKDTGIGIAAKNQPYIFDRFRQIDNSSTRAYDGTGLGLAVTKALVVMHHGTIEVKSKVRQGATFLVRIPLKQPEDKAE